MSRPTKTSAQTVEVADLRRRLLRYDTGFAEAIERIEAQKAFAMSKDWNAALSAAVDILEEIKDQETGDE